MHRFAAYFQQVSLFQLYRRNSLYTMLRISVSSTSVKNMVHELRLQGLRVTDFLLKVTIPMHAMQCVRFS